MITDTAHSYDLNNMSCFSIQYLSLSNTDFIVYSRDLDNHLKYSGDAGFSIALGN